MPVNKDFYTLAGSSGQSTGYEIEQSIRFNQTDNASMSRTPSSASSRTTWTFSWWWKRGILSGSTNGTNQRQPIFGTTDFSILSNHNSTQIDGINVVYTGSANDIQTSEKYRDVSAWYHFVFVLDTTNNKTEDRVRLYKNGLRVTSFASITYPSKDTTYTVNNTQAHYIGFRNSGENLDGYLAEIHFVDGYAYDPSYFGEFDDFDNWIPKEYTGSYGTNGFKIDGRDSGDLGDDESGNGNDYTTSGMAAHDQVLDSPTNSFNTMNPLNPLNGGALSNGNLKNILSGDDQFYTTQELNFKSYCEVRIDALSNYGGTLGLGTFGGDDDDNSLVFQTNYSSGYIYLNGGNASANIGGTVSAGNIVMMAYDPTTRKWWVGVNGTWRNSGDPAGGTGQVYQHSTTDFGVGIGAIVWGGWKGSANGLTVTWNFGQEGTFGGQETAGGNSDSNGIGNFKYSVPSGFLANCTKNLFKAGG